MDDPSLPRERRLPISRAKTLTRHGINFDWGPFGAHHLDGALSPIIFERPVLRKHGPQTPVSLSQPGRAVGREVQIVQREIDGRVEPISIPRRICLSPGRIRGLDNRWLKQQALFNCSSFKHVLLLKKGSNLKMPCLRMHTPSPPQKKKKDGPSFPLNQPNNKKRAAKRHTYADHWQNAKNQKP